MSPSAESLNSSSSSLLEDLSGPLVVVLDVDVDHNSEIDGKHHFAPICARCPITDRSIFS